MRFSKFDSRVRLRVLYPSILWLACSLNVLGQMNYNVSVYTDLEASDDFSTVYGVSTIEDNSTLGSCYHSDYEQQIRVYDADNNEFDSTTYGTDGYTSAPIGNPGWYTMSSSGTLNCSCVFSPLSFSGGISIRLGVSVNIFQFSTVADGKCYYYPKEPCNTKCRSPQISGPYPCYAYVVENYPWFQYSSGPTGYFCVSGGRLAAPNNDDLSQQACFDRGLP